MNIAVIGGGISGLSTAFLISRKLEDAKVDVFEKASVPGGTIATLHTEGFVVEQGPNGFLSGKPTTLELVEKIGISEKLIEAQKIAEKRFICKNGKLKQLPEGPGQFLASSVLSFGGKLRICKEPFIRRSDDRVDETVAEFGKRRLGREAVDYLLDPMISGVFAGDVERLSLKSCFPRIHEMEQKYGSLVRAMFSLKAKKASPPGRLTSFGNGMSYLIDALAASNAFDLHLNASITEIECQGKKFFLNASDKIYDAVVLAIPAYALGKINFCGLNRVRDNLLSVPYPPVAVAAFAMKKGIAKGFGFLVPSRGNRKILGALFSSNIFAGRGTRERDLVSVLLGGDREHQVRDYSEEKIIDIASSELAAILGICRTSLETIATFRWKKAIPQYYCGHQALVDKIENLASEYPGLFITGNAFFGIGINDCTKAAFAIAEKVCVFFHVSG